MDAPRREISKDEVNTLPVLRYEGEIVVVDTEAAVQRALASAAASRVVGFDTETRPAFRPGESYLPSVFQLATADCVFVFQPQRFDCAAALRRILEDAGVVKAGVSVADDLKGLQKLFPFAEAAVLDLGHAAKRQGFRQTGVRNLAALVLGIRVPKGAKTTNWAAPSLTSQQLLYAATDAWVCRVLYLRFRELGYFEPQ
jgi:ribonuclease D